VSDNRPKTEKFAEFFNPKSRNFFGTGLTLEEFMATHMAEQVSRSWTIQPREEQKRRLHLVIELATELTKVRAQITFSTALAEAAIEAVITGDWTMVNEWARYFTFEDECEGVARGTYQSCAPFYARFRELLVAAYETRPDAVKVKA
jgi:hypothetical protein